MSEVERITQGNRIVIIGPSAEAVQGEIFNVAEEENGLYQFSLPMRTPGGQRWTVYGTKGR